MISIWKKNKSRKSGKPYYTNILTNESKCTVPNKNGNLIQFQDESNDIFIMYIPNVKESYTHRNSIEFSPKQIDISTTYVPNQTIGDCIKELIEGAYDIYSSIVSLPYETTIICGGQSPAYYCLAMMNFPIYNEKANIIILPHSKAGVTTEIDEIDEEDIKYCARLKEKGIELKKNVIIIDSVHSGTGILSLERALYYCYQGINVKKISINNDHIIPDVSKYNFRCQSRFSDNFPRIVNSYHPRIFHDPTNFVTDFINLDNPIAEMIVDIAKKYPEIKVEDTEWYQLNNITTQEIEAAKTKYKIEQERLKQYQLEYQLEKEERLKQYQLGKEESARVAKETALASAQTFEPIKTKSRYGDDVYQCPNCKNQYNTKLVLQNKWECHHAWNCPNQYRKIIHPHPYRR